MKVNLFTAASGLNTVDDPVRVVLDGETAVTDLAEAANISITRTGRPGLRVGHTLHDTSELHSLFCDNGPCFVAKEFTSDSSIMQVANDLTLSGIRSGLTKYARVSFAKAPGGEHYYANGHQNGVIIDGISYEWPDHTSNDFGEQSRVFHNAPVGEHIAIGHGRMWISYEEDGKYILAYSEPFAYGRFDLSRCYFLFPSRVRMIREVVGGMYISDSTTTYFYRGTDPASMEPNIIANFPALEWSDAIEKVECLDIGLDPGLGVLWASPEGAILGHPQGFIKNLNKEKIIYPEDVRQGAGLLRGYHYWHVMR